MTNLSQVFRTLRKKNIKQYALLAGCCFFSVLLITAYVSMMRSPTVLNVLPVGGDSRKQVMMIFVLAVIGCGAFTTYASGLFFRYKSREMGVFMALGASKNQLKRQLTSELALLAVASCGLGALLGTPLALSIWQFFRLAVVDTQEMALTFDPQAYGFAFVFSAFVLGMLFFMLVSFMKRTNIIDVVNESRKSEPIKDAPRWYGPVGLAMLAAGALLGYMAPGFIIRTFHWYPPGWLTSIAYLPALVGLYMVLIHTVVNGWRQGKSRYKSIISISMMKFQGRQTVRNMLVITVLVAGAYFAAFYTPMLATGTLMGYDARPIDYEFHYRADQNMLTEAEIRQMAEQNGVAITSYTAQPRAVLGVDGKAHIESEGRFGITYTTEYRELLASDSFLSESAYNALMGTKVDIKPGTVKSVFDDEGSGGGMMSTGVTRITNVVTGQVMTVTPEEETLHNSLLFGTRVLDDADYAHITTGLTEDWLEQQVCFNVENVADTYDFAKGLFYTIIDRSGPEAEVFSAWDPVSKINSEQKGEPYLFDNENLAANGFEPIEYSQKESSSFRMDWKYMPKFRVLDKADFVKNMAVFLMLFIFIAIVCFAAVIVIAYTRSLTIGMTSAQMYGDLRHLGATNRYLENTVKGQISKVFFVPIATGTTVIYAFYMMIMYFNDGGIFSQTEVAGLVNCLLLIGLSSVALYGVYRFTLRKVCNMLHIKMARWGAKK